MIHVVILLAVGASAGNPVRGESSLLSKIINTP